MKLRFGAGLVWTVDLTVEMKLRFSDGLVRTVDLTVEIKLRFRAGLVWTVDLTVEVKLRFKFLRRSLDGVSRNKNNSWAIWFKKTILTSFYL